MPDKKVVTMIVGRLDKVEVNPRFIPGLRQICGDIIVCDLTPEQKLVQVIGEMGKLTSHSDVLSVSRVCFYGTKVFADVMADKREAPVYFMMSQFSGQCLQQPEFHLNSSVVPHLVQQALCNFVDCVQHVDVLEPAEKKVRDFAYDNHQLLLFATGEAYNAAFAETNEKYRLVP